MQPYRSRYLLRLRLDHIAAGLFPPLRVSRWRSRDRSDGRGRERQPNGLG